MDESFGERLRRYRERASLTQEELGERAGLTALAISALERGERRRPYPTTVRALADALGLVDQERAAFVALVPRGPGGQAKEQSVELSAAPASSLPPQPTPLLGRDEELAVLLD